MTKRHFVALAAALRTTQASAATIAAIAQVCQQFNPRFDVAKFAAAATREV